MTILKAAIKALIQPTFASFGITAGSFLAIIFTATAMDTKKLLVNKTESDKRLSSIRDGFNTLMHTSLNTDKHKVKVRFANPVKIGYGDRECIEDLNSINIPTDGNEPLVNVTFETESNIVTATEEKISQILDQADTILSHLSTNNSEELKERNILSSCLMNKIYQERQLAQKIQKQFAAIVWPPVIPIKHLENNSANFSIYGQIPVTLTFDNNQKLTTLTKKFKKKPTTLFCTLTEEIAIKILSVNEQTTEETQEIIIEEATEQINAKKEEFRTNKLIKRRPRQNDDLQDYSFELFPNSYIVKHESNYHIHGENGYSEKKRKNEVLTNLNENIFTYLNDREGGYKKRKLSSTAYDDKKRLT